MTGAREISAPGAGPDREKHLPPKKGDSNVRVLSRGFI